MKGKIESERAVIKVDIMTSIEGFLSKINPKKGINWVAKEAN